MGSEAFESIVYGLHPTAFPEVGGLPLLDLLLRAAGSPSVQPTELGSV